MWKFRDRLVRVAARQGFTVRRHLGPSDYEPIFALLRPVATEHELKRFGGDGDGGYLLPDDLDGIETCFSPGVDYVASFEEAMLARGMEIFQVDASVEKSPLTHPRNHFESKFLGIETRGIFVTLDDWVNDKAPAPTNDLMLQMDIEGAEWLSLAQVSVETLIRFRVMAIEFHDLARIAEPSSLNVFRSVLEKLNNYFDVVHIHANNCSRMLRGKSHNFPDVVEVTYLRKDRSTTRRPVDVLPHPLDHDCCGDQPPIAIPPEIYRAPDR